MRLIPRRAESLIESMIAVTIVVIATTAALVLIQTSISGNRIIKEKIVAMNLALEGIEAVKNIRDTNYLNFASKPEDCWNAIKAQSITECDLDGSNTADRMEAGDTYYFKRNLRDEEKRLMWTLETNTNFENITHYEIYDSTSTTVIAEIYAQVGLDVLEPSTYVVLEEDVYTRKVEFSDNDFDPDNSIDATVTVTWDDKGNEYSVSLTRTIANVY